MDSVARPEPHPDVGTELVRDWTPEAAPKAMIVVVHGIAEHSGRYEQTGALLADLGFHVRAFDLIGHGATGGDRVDIDRWERFHDQIESHVSWAMGQGAPVVLMGHSLGGNLALGYVIAGRPAPDLLVVSAPALAGGAPWQRALAGIGAKLAPTLSIPQKISGEDLSRDPQVGEAYLSDPLVHTSATIRFGASLFEAMDEVAGNAHLVEVPTLVLHGGADRLVPPQSTVALGRLPGFDRRLYPALRHEVLNEPEGPEIVAEIAAWIEERV